MKPTSISDGLTLLTSRALQFGGIFEVRYLKTPDGTVSGFFDSIDAAVEEINRKNNTHSFTAEGCYVTLNPLRPDLLERSANRFTDGVPRGFTATDADVMFRVWLPIDVDPVRPRGTSATDGELKASCNRRDEIVSYLTSKGWPEAIKASGGNSGHALYPLALPNDTTGDVVKPVLKVLKEKFETPQLTVDASVSNAGRIWTIYGTRKCKGNNFHDRPHRVAWIDSVPGVTH